MGAAIWICGVFLLLGNVSGFMRTFPYAGLCVTGIGFIIQTIGNMVSTNRKGVSDLETTLDDLQHEAELQKSPKRNGERKD
jgi:hypothetical protein